MDRSAPSLPPVMSWRWIATFWFVGAVFEATQSVFIQHALGKRGGEPLLFAVEVFGWLPWALATPFVVDLARRHALVPAPTARGVSLHLATLLAISMAAQAWSSGLQMLFNPWAHRQAPTFWDTWSHTLVFHGLLCVFAYALILAITYLVDSRDKIARKATEAAQLNEALSKAQLAALRRQMEPHFMFNTLNSIVGLVRDNRNTAAISMIVGLSEMLRRASQDLHKPEVTLAEEVEYLQRYIGIQKIRFAERLEYSVDVPQSLMDAKVPSLLLQPLVENAIKHGLSDRVAGGSIRVSASGQDTVLCLTIYNNGAHIVAEEARGDGAGLANLRARLQIMYGDAADLLVNNVADGVEVTVTLPWTNR